MHQVIVKHTTVDPARATAAQLIERLRSLGDPKNVAGMAHYGINVTAPTFGVPVPLLRAMAREVGRSHSLALALWETGVHDARHLAPMLADPVQTTRREMDRWARDLDSWDLCDGACFDLWRHTPHAYEKAHQWAYRRREFERRAGFALMAGLASGDKKAPDERFLAFLPVVEAASDDDRNFVRKAVNWALRQIGKRNIVLNRAAMATALRIADTGARPGRWIAGDALAELRSDAVQMRLRDRATRTRPRGRRR